MSRVLLVGLGKGDIGKISSYLSVVGVTCESVPTMENALERVPADPPTLIVAAQTDGPEPLAALQSTLQHSAPATPFLVVLKQPSTEAALSAMRAGAQECLSYPLQKFPVLAATKRACRAHGRALFGARVRDPKTPWTTWIFFTLLGAALFVGISKRWNGPPPATINLASATLSGIQWDGRSLWVGNWVESTIAHYTARKGLFASQRVLDSDEIFRMEDSQPILICNTPESLVTIGFDLKFRTHQRAVGLPTVQTAVAPGPSPTGLAWDGEALWSSDGQTGLLYKHAPDLRVLETLKSIIPNPTGLASDQQNGLWVIGGSPLRAAKLVRKEKGLVWEGPFALKNFLPQDVPPTGVAIGFGRLWVVTGGAPHMVSRPLSEIESQLQGWK